MTDTQLALIVIGLVFSLNTGVNIFLYTSLRGELNSKLDSLRNEMNARFDGMMQAILRVEGVLDARLKHLEER